MTSEARPTRESLTRLVGIGLVIAAMVAVVATAGRMLFGGDGPPPHPPVVRSPTGEPIAAEAHVFRLRPADVAVAPLADRRGQAHRRTLAMFRSLRAYPGAPPRIPHGLTSDEFRGTECKVCHQRGGWVQRFGAYAPMTPHPELRGCLQCHVPDDRVVGVPLPTGGADAVCAQCHDPDRPVPSFVATTWRPAQWPATNQRAMPGSPPAIPHGPELRGNCLACHMGAAAVEEIRTDHPERANCRQCHVPAEQESEFARPAERAARTSEGGS